MLAVVNCTTTCPITRSSQIRMHDDSSGKSPPPSTIATRSVLKYCIKTLTVYFSLEQNLSPRLETRKHTARWKRKCKGKCFVFAPLSEITNAILKQIADFGLSNVFDEKHFLQTFCGSPLYASPEIVRGLPYFGPEVDCWSLGVLLYTLVYGAMPFDGSNFKKLVKQISESSYYEPPNKSGQFSIFLTKLISDHNHFALFKLVLTLFASC